MTDEKSAPAEDMPANRRGNAPVERIRRLDWRSLVEELDTQGSTVLKGVLSPEECTGIAQLYPQEEPFRSTVVMARHGLPI